MKPLDASCGRLLKRFQLGNALDDPLIQIAIDKSRVLSHHDDRGRKGQIVADQNPLAGRNTRGQRFVGRIANADRQADAFDDRGGQIDDAEKLVIVLADAEIEPANSKAGFMHCRLNRIENAVVRDRIPASRATWEPGFRQAPPA